MSGAFKLPRFVFFHYCLLNSRQKFHIAGRPFTNCGKMTFCNIILKLNTTSGPLKMVVSREKSTKGQKTDKREYFDDDTDDEENDGDEDYNFKGDEVKTFETQVPRMDKIIKLCFKISRKDIEDLFYQTKVRVNGKLLKKKSINANIGDEIDIINGFVENNSKLLNVNKIEILNIKQDLDNLKYIIKVKKSKSLIVQNYKGNDEWRG